jgi:hypothetical protein
VRFFFPDSQDLVDPSFDFETEERSASRIRQRDDQYAHELFSNPPFDGLLVSKGVVDGFGETGSRYSLAQRHRLLRVGAPQFFRVPVHTPFPIIGDCGAFTYVRETTPPYSVEDVMTFYAECRFDLGISVDHVILAFDERWDALLPGIAGVPEEYRVRQQVTLDLAADFIRVHRVTKPPFEPLGAAQGWSPGSYAQSVEQLQRMGYKYVAVGGLVPLKTQEILRCLDAINAVRRSTTQLHLLGVTRTDSIDRFAKYGVVSFDSTSPLRQAFKDDRDNYYTMDRTYMAIRVPQVEGNPRLQKRIASGHISQQVARSLEQNCLTTFRSFDAGRASLDALVAALHEYEELYDPGADRRAVYRETLEAQPWKACLCEVCRSLGYHVILFRGAERNRRRGFHNIWTFFRRLQGVPGRVAKTWKRSEVRA